MTDQCRMVSTTPSITRTIGIPAPWAIAVFVLMSCSVSGRRTESMPAWATISRNETKTAAACGRR